MTSRTKKDASTHQNISEVKPLTPEEVDEMLLHDDTYESYKVLMKCDRCGCEMELDGYILSEIAEADGEGCGAHRTAGIQRRVGQPDLCRVRGVQGNVLCIL